jgi:hypothetical protein
MMSGVWFALKVMFHRLQIFLFRESTAAETPLAACTRGLKHSQNRGLQVSRASSTLQVVRIGNEAAPRSVYTGQVYSMIAAVWAASLIDGWCVLPWSQGQRDVGTVRLG